MPGSSFKVLLNLEYIQKYCVRHGLTKVDLCDRVGIDRKTLLPGLNEENPKEMTMVTLKKLHATIGGEFSKLSRDHHEFLWAADKSNLDVDFPKKYLNFRIPIRPTPKNLALAEKLFKAVAFALDASEDEIEFDGPEIGSIILKCLVYETLIPRSLETFKNRELLNLRRFFKTTRTGLKPIGVNALIFPPATCEARPSYFGNQAMLSILPKPFARLQFDKWKDLILQYAKRNGLPTDQQSDGSIVVRLESSRPSAVLVDA